MELRAGRRPAAPGRAPRRRHGRGRRASRHRKRGPRPRPRRLGASLLAPPRPALSSRSRRPSAQGRSPGLEPGCEPVSSANVVRRLQRTPNVASCMPPAAATPAPRTQDTIRAWLLATTHSVTQQVKGAAVVETLARGYKACTELVCERLHWPLEAAMQGRSPAIPGRPQCRTLATRESTKMCKLTLQRRSVFSACSSNAEASSQPCLQLVSHNSPPSSSPDLGLARLSPDDVRISRVGDGERRHAKVLTAGSAQINVVCARRKRSVSALPQRETVAFSSRFWRCRE
jgi:hypothetical protein